MGSGRFGSHHMSHSASGGRRSARLSFVVPPVAPAVTQAPQSEQ